MILLTRFNLVLENWSGKMEYKCESMQFLFQTYFGFINANMYKRKVKTTVTGRKSYILASSSHQSCKLCKHSSKSCVEKTLYPFCYFAFDGVLPFVLEIRNDREIRNISFWNSNNI